MVRDISTFFHYFRVDHSDYCLEDGDPSEADVIEGDGTLEGVAADRLALPVVLVPVDARSSGISQALHPPKHHQPNQLVSSCETIHDAALSSRI